VATTIFLLRHAAHDRVSTLLCGRMPGVALGAAGQAQAQRLARRLSREQISGLHTSPVQRCHETALAISAALNLPIVQAPAFAEIDFGSWTGQPFTALEADSRWRSWNTTRDTARAPDGESMREAQARAVAGIVALRGGAAGGIAIVTHADVIKAVVAHFLGLPLQAYERFEIAPASITTLVAWEGGGKILGLNDTAHDRAEDSPELSGGARCE